MWSTADVKTWDVFLTFKFCFGPSFFNHSSIDEIQRSLARPLHFTKKPLTTYFSSGSFLHICWKNMFVLSIVISYKNFYLSPSTKYFHRILFVFLNFHNPYLLIKQIYYFDKRPKCTKKFKFISNRYKTKMSCKDRNNYMWLSVLVWRAELIYSV